MGSPRSKLAAVGAFRSPLRTVIPWRRIPPVRSPVGGRAVLATLVGGDDSSSARVRAALTAGRVASDVVLTDSGTSALALAIAAALSHRPGRPVALPGYGCFDLATAALAARARVVLYDLDPATLQPCAESVTGALAAGAGALVLVHHHGIPSDAAAMRLRTDAAGAVLIEDCAQAAGSTHDGVPLGQHGACAVLSFGRGKGITGGSGGALLVNTREALDLAAHPLAPAAGSRAIAVVKLAAQALLTRPSLYAVPASLPFLGLGETRFQPPHAVRAMSDHAIAALEATLPLQSEDVASRRQHAERLLERLEQHGASAIRAAMPSGSAPGWLRLPFVARHPRTGLARAAALGVLPGYPIPLRELEPLRPSLVADSSTPGAARLAELLWTLPTHALLTSTDLEALERWIDSECQCAS